MNVTCVCVCVYSKKCVENKVKSLTPVPRFSDNTFWHSFFPFTSCLHHHTTKLKVFLCAFHRSLPCLRATLSFSTLIGQGSPATAVARPGCGQMERLSTFNCKPSLPHYMGEAFQRERVTQSTVWFSRHPSQVPSYWRLLVGACMLDTHCPTVAGRETCAACDYQAAALAILRRCLWDSLWMRGTRVKTFWVNKLNCGSPHSLPKPTSVQMWYFRQ